MTPRLQEILAARAAIQNAESRRALDVAWNRLCDLRRQAREEFAASRGWIAGPRFTTGKLLGLPGRHVCDVEGTDDAVDHRSCFSRAVAGSRKLRAIAIVSHVYGSTEPCFRFADRYALAIEVLSESWWWPGLATAVLLTRSD